jgi:hypothetical protein
MFTLDIKADVRPAIEMLNRIKAGLGDQAIASALNKTIAQAKTQMSRGIRDEYNISAALVRDRLVVQRASRNGLRFTATLVGNPAGTNRRAMNVIHFLERKTTLVEARKRGRAGTLTMLHFKIRRQGGKTTIAGAFIGNQGRTVFKRVGRQRLPIEPVQTIGVPQMFQAKKVQLPVQQWISDNFPRIFESDLRYFLSKVAR